MVAMPQMGWSPQAYLEFERASDEKHEYLDGEIYAMAGATENHLLVSGNAYASLHTQVRKRPCKVYQSDMRVRVTPTSYFYPDVVVVCGKPQFEDNRFDTLLNPTFLIEVLSKSTERFDRGKKSQRYRLLPSLQGYAFIAQDSYRIEYYARQSEGLWLFTEAIGLDATITLSAIDCVLRLDDVYDKVELEDE